MIEFVCTPLHVRIALRGYHGNHAISQGPNVFIFQKHCFLIHGVPRNNFGTNEKLSLGCKIGQIILFVCLFVLLLYVPSQQLWSLRDGQFT